MHYEKNDRYAVLEDFLERTGLKDEDVEVRSMAQWMIASRLIAKWRNTGLTLGEIRNMTYSQEREEFIADMAKEGLPVSVTRQVLAMANRLQRYAELSCNSEAADRDRTKCPADPSRAVRGECLCGYLEGDDNGHETVPKIDVYEARTQRRLAALFANRPGFTANFQGDPRGAVVKIAVPSGRYDDMGKVGLCVPSKGLPASFWDRNR